ncbi:MAG: PD40 domain-containing protein [Gemmatimonadetes bacterium]|nr:PD40 domain-containing protein [Gemmatimonadota bacterium]
MPSFTDRAASLPRLLLLALAALLVASSPARAQYFGRNKVQYETFDWKVMTTPHYKIHYYPEEKELVADAARMAERWNTRLTQLFQYKLSEVKPIIFFANHPDFEQNNLSGVSQGVGGFTEPLRTRLVMPFTGVYADEDHVLGHEMVHVYQYDIATSRLGGGLNAMERLPSWMIEGMAEYLSLGREDPLTAMWMRDAALTGKLPTLKQLNSDDPRYFPYRYGEALWAYIGGRWGDRAVTEVYRFSLREGPEQAIRRVLGVSSEQLGRDWLTAVRTAYLPLVEGRSRPADAAKRILGKEKPEDMNVGPELSPDGKYIAYFGLHDLFSIDLLLADAETGKIIRRLASPTNIRDVDDISFVYSAGSFSPDGKKFAFVVYADGDNQLAIVDVATGHLERRIDVKGVGEITSPAWSPDGSRIAFSGSKGGISDIYMVDANGGNVEQLTNDRYGDVHPAWSPDGKTIAFASDRAGTDFNTLSYSPMRIALLDLETNTVRVLPGFAEGKHINPQFSADGKSIYFISDHDGFADIYRQDIAGGQIFRVTHLATGVSGITALSPALSVARQTGRLAFSVFGNGGYDIYELEAPDAQGTPLPAALVADNSEAAEKAAVDNSAGVLAPVEARQSSTIVAYLRDPLRGLPPADATYASANYHSALKLDYLSQPSVGVGTSAGFGTFVGGGIAAYFGDMLGNQTVAATIQANGQIQDIGGEAFYINSARRWNWLVGAGHIPYLTGYTDIVPNTDPTRPGDYIIRQHLMRIFIDEAQVAVQYPFSQTRRVEFSGGYTHYGFSSQVYRYFAFGNTIVDQDKQDDPTFDYPSFHTFTAGAAYVGDYSFFGFTSPIMGGRYRFEVSPTVGTMNFESILADVRRYFFKNPFTFAIRGLHYGRYGTGAADTLLTPLYLGYPTLVRGYEIGNLDGSECSGDPTTPLGCPEFNRLYGSKVAVFNAEIRVPLFGVPQYGLIHFPFLPTEIAPFFDAGLAWGPVAGLPNSDPKIRFATRSTDRIPVFSTGVSARFNVLGALVAEVYYAYPFQRPDKGGHWGVNIAPGW